MSEPFLGQIKMMGFDFAPRGHALCNGQLLPIAQNTALFSLLGATYGGNGVQSFGLPDLRTRTPIHYSSEYPLGSAGGQESVQLNSSQIPAHAHSVQATIAPGTSRSPKNAVFASGDAMYGPLDSTVQLAWQTIGPSASLTSHDNMQPYLKIPFFIALTGIFPPQN